MTSAMNSADLRSRKEIDLEARCSKIDGKGSMCESLELDCKALYS
jgi:hypothetical protein